MKIVMGNFQVATPTAATVAISKAANDPVPSCKFSIYDSGSALQALAYQEVLVIDDKVIPNPTINLLFNPTLNPYNNAGNWIILTVPSGVSLSQNAGGGVKATFSNTAVGFSGLQQIQPVQPGQSYMFSITIAGSSPVNIVASLQIAWLNAAQIGIGLIFGNTITPGSASSYSLGGTAPADAAYCQVTFYYTATNATNSGSITYTNAMLEPQWFSTQSYPTPFCGPSQTNCRQLPLGQHIRQYRKFAGFVTSADYGDYVGNNRTIQITASGYAWVLGTILSNKSYSSQYDSAILSDLLSTYLVATVYTGSTFSTIAMCSTTNIIQGVQLSSFVLNWDDLRTAANNLASQIGWYWGIDDYWNASYAPPGYISAAIGLICDHSSTPDNVTTFPAYNFIAKMDATQPGSNILVLGSGSNTAQVIDPAQINVIGMRSGYILPTTTSWMRKVNESSLNSVSDCTQRGMAELLQYDYERFIYTLTTDNVELMAGQAIQITSATDNLSNTTLLIQQVQATWIGKSELLSDVWEYNATLGSINRQVASIMSRIFRATNSNTSAPAINTTTLVVLERIGVLDTFSQGTVSTGYQPTIMADTPVAYYRLDEVAGTIADDFSGYAQAGTLHGGITLLATGLLHSGSDTAMSFNGSSGYISLPNSGAWPTGNGAWSLECWCKPTSSTPGGAEHIVTIGNPGTNGATGAIVQSSGGGWGVHTWGGAGHDFDGNGTSTAGTIYYLAAIYDGASHLRLYVGGGGNFAIYGPFNCGTLNLSASHQQIGNTWNGSVNAFYFGGTIDEPAIYNAALTLYQVQQHMAAGSSPYAVAVRSNTPAVYYRLDEPSGTTAHDWSGNGYDGTLHGTLTLSQSGALTGDPDTSILFDGSSGYIDIPGGVAPTSAFTLECWFKAASYSNYPRLIANDNPAANNKGLELLIAPSGDGSFGYINYGITGGSHSGDGFGSSAPTIGTWYHVAATWDGTTLTVYVNGNSVLSGTRMNLDITGTYAYRLGQNHVTGDYFHGDLDEPAIYTTALSASQILAHYTAGTT